MGRFEVRVVGGILLIAAGILFLLQNLGILGGGLALLWALLFGTGGAVFLYVFLTDHAAWWWAVIPGFALLSIGAIIALDRLAPRIGGNWGGVLVLGSIALAFWVIYLTNRENWWAVIPGGVLLTTALITGLSSAFEGIETGGVFLMGLGLTFGLLSLIRTPEGRMKWALIPAAVLLIIGMLVTAATVSLLAYLWPVALILVGLYVIARVLLPRRGE
jgi:hypothetical protein